MYPNYSIAILTGFMILHKHFILIIIASISIKKNMYDCVNSLENLLKIKISMVTFCIATSVFDYNYNPYLFSILMLLIGIYSSYILYTMQPYQNIITSRILVI